MASIREVDKMKKLVKTMLGFSILFMLLLSTSYPVQASSVTYVNQADKFVFVPENTDLFENFKGVMPGDQVAQTIFVKNDSKIPVKIYLKINTIQSEDDQFLKQLTLTMNIQGVDVFNETLDQQGQFKQFILLAELKPQQQKTLDLLLDVPLTLSSEYMEDESEIKWIFKVEEGEGEVANLPDTGSSSQHFITLSGGMMIIFGLLLITKSPKRKR